MPNFQEDTGNYSFTSGDVEVILNNKGYVIIIMTFAQKRNR